MNKDTQICGLSFDWDNISGNWSVIITGLIILVPVVYVSLRLQFYDYFLIDEECRVMESVKKSINATKGYAGELFLLGAILSIIILIKKFLLMIVKVNCLSFNKGMLNIISAHI